MKRDIALDRAIQRAESGEKSESRIQLEMERVWRVARRDDASHVPDVTTGELLDELEEIDRESPIIEALYGVVRWERENEYHDGAVQALLALEDVVDQGLKQDWYNVSQYATVLAASIASDTGDVESTQEWLNRCLSLFGDHWRELTPNTRTAVLDVVPEIQHRADTDLVDGMLGDLRSIAADNVEDDYELQRQVLRSIRAVLHARGRDTGEVENHLVDSYSKEAALKRNSPNQKAILLQEALDRCTEYADEDQLLEWKREMRAANRAAIEEMPRREHELDDDELEQLETAIDDSVENLRRLSTSESPMVSLLTLLANPTYVPQLDALESSAEAAPILELVSTRHMKSEGDAIPDPEDSPRPSTYSFGVQHRDNVLTAVLRRVFSEQIVTEGDLYLYLEAADHLTVHDKAYLTDFVVAYFDGRFADALHLGVPRLEGLIASELKSKGYETASLQDGYTTPTPLPGLLNMLDGEIDDDLIEYLRYRYADISGEGLRNSLAHGRISYQHANRRKCLILLYDVFRTLGWLEDELSEYDDG